MIYADCPPSLADTFAPREHAKGYHAHVQSLGKRVCDMTGYDAISLTSPIQARKANRPGLLAIRPNQAARGEPPSKGLPDPIVGAGTHTASARVAGSGGRGGRLRRTW